MKKYNQYTKPEIQIIQTIDVILASGGGGEEGDGGYVEDPF